MKIAGSKPRSIELFTGAGGLALATHLSGFEHVNLFEWNDDACQTLRYNSARTAVPGLSHWRSRVVEGDIRHVDFSSLGSLELVAGGPPCQPFSLGGKHAGMEDQRDMIPHFIRAVRECKPRAFVMENVKGLTRRSFAEYLSFSILQLTYPEIVRERGEVWENHLARLHQHHTSNPRPSGLTYNVVSSVLNSADYGVPQCRERIFIVGFRNDIDANWRFPKPSHSQETLLHEQFVNGRYWQRVGVRQPKEIAIGEARLRSIRGAVDEARKPWVTIREAIADLPAPFKDKNDDGIVFNHKLQAGARPYPGHTGSPIDAPSKTLKAGDHGVPGGENMIALPDGTFRYLTIREAARVQTFPDKWRFAGAWSEAMRQLGNAVPVELARVVAESIRRTLEETEKH